MGFNALSFLGGLGTGGLNQWQRNQEADRQERLDQRAEQESNLRQKQLQGQIDDQNQQRSDRNALRGIGIGDPNDPTVYATATANHYRSIGQPERAMEIEAQAAKFKNAMYEAGREAGYKGGLSVLAEKGPAGLADFYNTHYKDGRSAVFESDGKGGGVLRQMDKDGNELGALPFANADDLAEKYRDLVYPEKRAERLDAERRSKAAAQADMAKDANKVHSVAPGAILANGTGQVLARNDAGFVQDGVNPDGTPRMVRAGGGRSDHFDAKQWDVASKIPSHIVSLPSPMGDGKDVEDGSLRSAYMQTFNAAKASGTMAPNEAAEHATTTIVKLKDLAAARVAKALATDKKSTLTVNQAVRDILKEASQFRPQPAPGASQSQSASAGYANEGQMRATVNGGMGADPNAIRREIDAATADLKTVSDPQSKAALEAHVVDLQRQLANIGGQPAQQPAARPSSQPAAKPAPAKGPTLTHGEQQFANVAAKSGWQFYSDNFGTRGEAAYRKPDGDGGWTIKTASELAKDLGVLY